MVAVEYTGTLYDCLRDLAAGLCIRFHFYCTEIVYRAREVVRSRAIDQSPFVSRVQAILAVFVFV